MSTKDVSDVLVCRAVAIYKARERSEEWPYEILNRWTGEPEKVCLMAMERAVRHGLLEYGVSLRTAWLSKKGKQLIGDTK